MRNVTSELKPKSICIVCGTEYQVYHKSRQKYCSSNCRVKGNRDEQNKKFLFLKRDYLKPKFKKEVVKVESQEWIELNQRLQKHKKQKEMLESKRYSVNSKLIDLTSKNKDKITYALICAGITSLGGYLLISNKDKFISPNKGVAKKHNKMISSANEIPIGILILGVIALGAAGYGLGYMFGSISDSVKSKKRFPKIKELNDEVTALDAEIRIEQLNIDDICKSMALVNQYSSITEKIVTINNQT